MAWSVRFSLNEALHRTARWYQAYFEGQDSKSFVLDDVEVFLRRPNHTIDSKQD